MKENGKIGNIKNSFNCTNGFICFLEANPKETPKLVLPIEELLSSRSPFSILPKLL